MTDQGVVYDLGYKPHDGPRLGRGAAVRATIRDGLRRVFGLRRKARKKVLPFLLLGIAVLPAVVFVGFAFLTSMIALEELGDSLFADHASYFSYAGGLVLLFCALAGPELLVSDRTDGVLAVYSSRPMTIFDYLGARAAALAAAIGLFLLVPQFVLYLGYAALREGGFLSNLITNGEDLFQVVLTTVVFLLAYGAPAFLVAVFARRVAPATGAYVGIMFASQLVAQGFTEAGTGWASLVALPQHPLMVRDWIFDRSSDDLAPAIAGFDPWVSLVVIVGMTALSLYVGVRRYRSLL